MKFDSLCYLHRFTGIERGDIPRVQRRCGDEERSVRSCRCVSNRGGLSSRCTESAGRRARCTRPGRPSASGPPQPMGFFVTSVGLDGGNLGGLQGADAHCQKLAAASGREGAGNRVWRAYLSTQGPSAVNARDRIGTGPWANARGQVVARDLAHLHGDTRGAGAARQQPQQGDGPHREEHARSTALATRDRWEAAQPARHSDRLDHGGPRVPGWRGSHLQQLDEQLHGSGSGRVISIAPAAATRRGTAAHASKGCSQPNLVATGGNGYFYCFAEK